MERMMGAEGAEKDFCYHLSKIFELNNPKYHSKTTSIKKFKIFIK